MLCHRTRRCVSIGLAISVGLAVSGAAIAQLASETAASLSLQVMGAPANSTISPLLRGIRQDNLSLPNDPLSEQQWSFMSRDRYLGAADIFSIQHNAQQAPVIVAIVDSGLQLNHEDYFTLPGYDFIRDPAVANDGDGRDSDASDPGDWVTDNDRQGDLSSTCSTTNSRWHGTAIAGIVGAESENQTGIAGAAREVRLLPVRVTGKCGGYVRDLIDGIRWSAGLGVSGVPDNATPARVINLSVGFPGRCSSALQQAVNDATNAGSILVTAATNSTANLDEEPHSPASCQNVLTIGATLRDGSVAQYSATGSPLFLMGPGGSSTDGIISTDNNGTREPAPDSSYGYHYGTSLAAAHVSATLATLLSAEPSLSNAQLRAALKESAIPTTDSKCSDNQCGAGLLNSRRAVQLLLDGEVPDLKDEPLPPVAAAAKDEWEDYIGSMSASLALLLPLMMLKRRRRTTGGTTE